jgi:predicted transcriptional regulator of viral defense system
LADYVGVVGKSNEKEDALISIAEGQGGYFTAKQVLQAGYSYRDQHYHKTRGNWVQIERGVYRLRNYPYPQRDDLLILSLLSHNRAGEPQAVVSHESALAIHEMSDANPARIHLTVPPGFRKQIPSGIVLHKASLSAKDWIQHDGYRVTTPLRTLLDVAESPSGWTYLADAVYDALYKGLVRSAQLLAADTRNEARKWLVSAIEATEQRIYGHASSGKAEHTK